MPTCLEIDVQDDSLDLIIANGNRAIGILLVYSDEDDRDVINDLLDAIKYIKQNHWDLIIHSTLTSYLETSINAAYYLNEMSDVKAFINDNKRN